MQARLLAEQLRQPRDQVFELGLRDFDELLVAQYARARERVADVAPAAAELVDEHLDPRERMVVGEVHELENRIAVLDRRAQQLVGAEHGRCHGDRPGDHEAHAHLGEVVFQDPQALEDRQVRRVGERIDVHQLVQVLDVVDRRRHHAVDTDFGIEHLRPEDLAHRAQAQTGSEADDAELLATPLEDVDVHLRVIAPLRCGVAEKARHGLLVALDGIGNVVGFLARCIGGRTLSLRHLVDVRLEMTLDVIC